VKPDGDSQLLATLMAYWVLAGRRPVFWFKAIQTRPKWDGYTINRPVLAISGRAEILRGALIEMKQTVVPDARQRPPSQTECDR
jgi:hypothetical protein